MREVEEERNLEEGGGVRKVREKVNERERM